MSRMASQPAGPVNSHGGALRPPRKYTPSETTQIYTDWANHYLEKIKSKRRIQDLSKDVVDGIVLADVIEAVLNQKLPDVNRKPKTSAQMVDNISACLKLLGALGIPLEGVTPVDIHQGNLKSILVIFFALSRHKQQQKLMQQREHAVSPIERAVSATLAKTASPGQTRYPPSSSRVQHGPGQLRPPSSTATSAASSRSTSPSLGNASHTGVGSLIPRCTTKAAGALPTKITSIKTPVTFANQYHSKQGSAADKTKLVKPNEHSTPYAVSSVPMQAVNEPSEGGLTTLAVFDHQSIPIKSTALIKDKSIKSRSSSTKSSPKLASKVKREPENRSNKFPELTNIKPFSSASGIPKPMAAVKGTAKMVQKPDQVDLAARERTPGDGKEVSEGCVAAVSPVEAEKSLNAPISTNGFTQVPQDVFSCQENSNPEPPATNEEKDAGRLFPSAGDEDLGKEANSSHSEPANGCGGQVSGKQVTENEEEESVNVQPMVPLFAADDSLKRIPRLSGNFSGPKRATAFSDTLDGYMSESGASLYARKAARFAINHRNRDCDSLDDSSSLSSANTDPWNEMYALLKVNDTESTSNAKRLNDRQENTNIYSCASQFQPIHNGMRAQSVSGPAVPAFRDFIDLQCKSTDQKEPIPLPKHCNSQQISSTPAEDLYSVSVPKEMYSSEDRLERRTAHGATKHVVQRGVQPALGPGNKVAPGSAGMPTAGDKPVNANLSKLKTAKVAAVPKLSDGQRRTNEPVQLTANRPRAERPKTRLKVSGGTQTELVESQRYVKSSRSKSPVSSGRTAMHGAVHSDSEYQSIERPSEKMFTYHPPMNGDTKLPFKSYSLTSPIASQLSQNVRERLIANGTQHYSKSMAYNERGDKSSGEKFAAHLFAGILESHKASILDESNYAEARGSSEVRRNGFGAATEEALSDTPYTSYWNKYNPKNGNDHKHSDVESVDSGPVMAPPWYMSNTNNRLNRSSSVRSTKSEDTYSPMAQQKDVQGAVEAISNPVDEGVIYQRGRSRSSFGNPVTGPQKLGRNEEDYRGSSVSLFSTASSLYSTQEEQQASEIRKLRRELAEAQEKIQTLSGQLSTNAHVVAAFEQSLASMTSRLQTLTVAAEQKDHELQELRTFLDRLRRREADPSIVAKLEHHRPLARQGSDDSVSSSASLATNFGPPETPSNELAMPSSCSTIPSPSMKKKSWLRSSFSKAFSRSKRPSTGNVRQQSIEPDSDDSCASSGINGVAWSAPSSPMLPYHQMRQQPTPCADTDKTSAVPETLVQDLKKQLREKDMILTDIRLEALSSAHQLEALKETLFQMRNEMTSLKKDNERLQKQINAHHSGASSPLNGPGCHHSPVAPAEEMSSIMDQLLGKSFEEETIVVPVYLEMNCNESAAEKPPANFHNSSKSWIIGYTPLCESTEWGSLDGATLKLFNSYLAAVDPQYQLGLDDTCLSHYRIGSVVRSLHETIAEYETPQPFAALPESERKIILSFNTAKSAGSLASLVLDTLVPLQEISSHIQLLRESHRVLIVGSPESGKSYYAGRLAESVARMAPNTDRNLKCVVLKVEPEKIKETRQYFAQLCDIAATGRTFKIPDVIVLEDVHQLKSGEEVSGLIPSFCAWNSNSEPPTLILTSVTAPDIVTHLQDYLSFKYFLKEYSTVRTSMITRVHTRVISFTTDCEPAKGFLRRFLKKRLLEYELITKTHDRELERVFDWLPSCLDYLNTFLETRRVKRAQIGHRLFLQAPTDLTCSHVWFVDLWNYTLGPYLLNALREGHAVDGAKWQDPTEWVVSTSPWSNFTFEKLLRLRAEDLDFS